jgi:hypothetical protein
MPAAKQNQYKIVETHVEVVLSNCDLITKVDKEDLKKVLGQCWRISADGYVMTTLKGSRKKMQLGRFILALTDPTVFADHIDLDKLNNQRANLRALPPSLSAQNRGIYKNNTSGYPGVSFETNKVRAKPWKAYIKLKGKRYHLGYFATPEEAYEVRMEAQNRMFSV